MAIDHVFKALGDPARLEIVRRLAQGSPETLGNISKGLGMSRQGARKQIQVLVQANVIRLETRGRETDVYLNTSSLGAAKQFIANIENQWDQRLAALKQFAESPPTRETKKTKGL